MTKKIIGFILAALILCGLFTAAGAEEQITIQDIMAANTMEAILTRHGNAAQHAVTDEGSLVLYMDKDIRYQHFVPKTDADGDEYEVIMSGGATVEYEPRYDVYYYVANVGLGYDRVYTPGDEHFGSPAYDPEATALETVVDVKEEDGALVVTTETPAALLNEMDRGIDYPEDGVYVVEYTLDKETLEILGTVEYLRRASGEKEENTQQTLMYDIAPTDDITTMTKALDVITNGKPQRTVTFILRPGAADEKKTEVTLASGIYVFFWADGKGYETFADPEGLTPWEDNLLDDQVVYLINPLLNNVTL